jgi:hypothetical protein
MLTVLSLALVLAQPSAALEGVREQGPVRVATYTAPGPLRYYVTTVDLTDPDVRVETRLSHDRVGGNETVPAIAQRTGATLAVNGDVWGPNGVPQGLCVVDGDIVMAPKCRAAFGVWPDGEIQIQRFIDAWGWSASVTAPGGGTHPIFLTNSDLNDGWVNLYTPEYGLSEGEPLSGTSAVVLEPDNEVFEVLPGPIKMDGNQPGLRVPPGYRMLVGRGSGADWLTENLSKGDKVQIDLGEGDYNELQWAVGAGPMIVVDGEYYADPITDPWTPPSEEWPANYKQRYFLQKHPRSSVGVSRDGETLIFITVDGRQPDLSVGVTLEELAELHVEHGSWRAMNLDGGGSATLVFGGELINSPSDGASATGGDGNPRAVVNAIVVFVD